VTAQKFLNSAQLRMNQLMYWHV